MKSSMFKALAFASGLAASLARPLISPLALAAPFVDSPLFLDSPLALERAEDSLENECQNLDNCPHCFNNTRPDYDPANPSGLVVDDALAGFMNATEAQYIAAFTKMYPPSSAATGDASIFGGSGGSGSRRGGRLRTWRRRWST